jgi:SulP family sulfate permease
LEEHSLIVIGRTFGGSKYQVYDPTAAFISVIVGLVHYYNKEGFTFESAHRFLVPISIISGVILVVKGIFGVGRYAKLVPNSINVGFTVGIAVAIVMTNLKDILGLDNYAALLGDSSRGFMERVAMHGFLLIN